MKYKQGDRVRIKSLDWYNRYTNGTEVDCGAYPFTSDMKEFCGQERIIANVCQECYVLLGIDDRFVWTDEMIEGLVDEETKPNIIEEAKTYWDSIKDAWICPEGYQFVDANGNVINATKIVLEKKEKEYPKTYEECCDVLSIPSYYKLRYYTYEHGYNEYTTLNKLCSLQDKLNILGKLIICRDAYWKIAGEEMGLGKPWSPDLTDNVTKHCIEFRDCGVCKVTYSYTSRIFAFPTKEMRDAFYENFKSEIGCCKELL